MAPASLKDLSPPPAQLWHLQRRPAGGGAGVGAGLANLSPV